MRSSSLEGINHCRATIQESDKAPEIRETSEPARMGTASHAVAAAILKGEEPDIAQIAMENNVDTQDVEVARDRLAKIIGDDPAAGGTIISEKSLEMMLTWEGDQDPHQGGFTIVTERLTGHPDLVIISVDGKRAIVIDWKTGRLEVTPADRNPQLVSYMIFVALLYPDIVEFVGMIVYTRLGWTDEAPAVTREWLLGQGKETITDMVAQARSPNPEYSPGPFCTYCRGRHFCPMMNKEISPLFDPDRARKTVAFWNELSEAQKGGAVAIATFYKAVAKDVLKVARKHVEKTGVPLDVGQDMEYGPVKGSQRVLDVEKAWPVVSELMPDELPSIVKLPITNVEKAWVAKRRAQELGTKRAPGGWLGGVMTELRRKLAHAITKKETIKFTTVPMRADRKQVEYVERDDGGTEGRSE